MDEPGAASVTLAVPAQASYFDGHFPGDPMVPGAKLLELVVARLVAAGAIDPGPIEVAAAKFVTPVRPGATLALTWAAEAGGVKFTCRIGAVLAAGGTLRRTRTP